METGLELHGALSCCIRRPHPTPGPITALEARPPRLQQRMRADKCVRLRTASRWARTPRARTGRPRAETRTAFGGEILPAPGGRASPNCTPIRQKLSPEPAPPPPHARTPELAPLRAWETPPWLEPRHLPQTSSDSYAFRFSRRIAATTYRPITSRPPVASSTCSPNSRAMVPMTKSSQVWSKLVKSGEILAGSNSGRFWTIPGQIRPNPAVSGQFRPIPGHIICGNWPSSAQIWPRSGPKFGRIWANVAGVGPNLGEPGSTLEKRVAHTDRIRPIPGKCTALGAERKSSNVAHAQG